MERFIEQNNEQIFDILVIGGGITGAAVAYEAASQGLHVALVEKGDFGGATSAATSKLIHGGLRYLANMEFGLVRESLRERRRLGNMAPNLVYPIPFLLPGYRHYKGNMWKMKAGMWLYDLLSWDKKFAWDKTKILPNHFEISRQKALEKEPNLKPENLAGATIFYDSQSIFPERLTLNFIKSAVAKGAKVSNYTKVTDFMYGKNFNIEGVKTTDLLSEKQSEIRANLVINCGGTWADLILQMASKAENAGHKVKRSEGIHIITKRIAGEHVVSIAKEEGGHFMIMPWRGYTLIGTTDKEYNGHPDDYKVSKESIVQIIDDVNQYFGDGKLTYNDVKFCYGGLRPLIDDQTKGSYKSSRKYEVYDNATDGIEGLITVEGGKYTTSRNLAEQVLKMVEQKLGKKLKKSRTSKHHLVSCEIDDMNQFIKDMHDAYSDFDPKTVEYLARNYGTECHKVLALARKNTEYQAIVSHDGEITAEIVYAIENEMAKTLKDILFRRTGIGTLGHPGNEILQKTANIAANLLHWNNDRKEAEIQKAAKLFEMP